MATTRVFVVIDLEQSAADPVDRHALAGELDRALWRGGWPRADVTVYATADDMHADLADEAELKRAAN